MQVPYNLYFSVFFSLAEEEEEEEEGQGQKQESCLENQLSVDAETAFPNLSMVYSMDLFLV